MHFSSFNGNSHQLKHVCVPGAQFSISGIFDMYTVLQDDYGQKTKKLNIQTGFHFREAYRLALKKVNEMKILHGFNVLEDIKHTDNVPELVSGIFYSNYVLAKPIVSPVESYSAFQLSLPTEALSVPVISHSEGSNHDKKPKYLFRATPIDEYKLSAMVALVKKLNWNYIAVISSNERSGDFLAKEFKKHIYKFKICFAKSVDLPTEPTISEYVAAIKEVRSVKTNGLVLFTTNKDSIGLAMAMRKLSVKGKFQILAASGFANYVEVYEGNEEYLEGAISVDYYSRELTEFRNHFLALKADVNDEDVKAFWEKTFACRFNNSRQNVFKTCTGKEQLKPGVGYYPSTPVMPVINSVLSMAYAMRSFIELKCLSQSLDPSCHIYPFDEKERKLYYFNYLKQFFLNNTFHDYTLNLTNPLIELDPAIIKFDIFNFVKENTGFVSKYIGSWTLQRNASGFVQVEDNRLRVHEGELDLNLSAIRWFQNRKIAVSSCRLPCPGGHVRIRHPNTKLRYCCWACVPCQSNWVSINDSCSNCGSDAIPDASKKQCIALKIRHFGDDIHDRKSVWIYIGLSSAGVISTSFVIFMFIRHNSNIIIRSSGRELCYVILVGIILLFLMPLTFILQPSRFVCSIRYLMPGIAFCICYSPLFLKVNRIYRIFEQAQSSKARPQLTSGRSQLYMVAGFVCVQMLLGVVWVFNEMPDADKLYYRHNGYVIYSCSKDTLPLILNLVFNVGLMCCCTWYAFKTRNFPKNYNESKYIAFTMYITSLCWALFLPTFFWSNSNDSHIREHLTCILVIVVAFTSLIGLFGHRIQMLLFPTEAQRQRQFSQLTRREADPHKFQLKTYSLNSPPSPRTASMLDGKPV